MQRRCTAVYPESTMGKIVKYRPVYPLPVTRLLCTPNTLVHPSGWAVVRCSKRAQAPGVLSGPEITGGEEGGSGPGAWALSRRTSL